MKITYQNSNPTVAKDVVQALLTVFAETTTGGNRREMENAKRFLDQQIETYATQLRAAEQRRAEFREKYMQLLPASRWRRLAAGGGAGQRGEAEARGRRCAREAGLAQGGA